MSRYYEIDCPLHAWDDTAAIAECDGCDSYGQITVEAGDE